MRSSVIRGCVAGAFTAAAIVISPASQALAATAVEYSAPGLGGKVNTMLSTDSLPGSDMKIPCTPGGLC